MKGARTQPGSEYVVLIQKQRREERRIAAEAEYERRISERRLAEQTRENEIRAHIIDAESDTGFNCNEIQTAFLVNLLRRLIP